VYKHAVADHQHHGPLGELLRIAAARRERRGAPACRGYEPTNERALFRRWLLFAELQKARRRHVAEVVLHVHRLVVAVQRMKASAGAARLLRKPAEQIEDFTILVAAIELVTGLDHDQLASRPVIPAVDGAGEPQSAARGVEIAVQVADGDHALRRGQPPGLRRERGLGNHLGFGA
jgi:hypothetical protein